MNNSSNTVNYRDFCALVSVLGFLNAKLALVFGSYLKNPRTANDLDLLLVSDCFKNVYYQHRSNLLPKKYLGKRIDPFCFTPKEFKGLFMPDQPFITAIKNSNLELIGSLEEYY